MSDVIRIASENYVNSVIDDLPSEIFIAEYGVTTIEELCEAYRQGKKLVCVADKGGDTEKYADLTYINGVSAIKNNSNNGIFVFSHVNNRVYTRYYYHNGWNTDSYNIKEAIDNNHQKIAEANVQIKTVQNLPIKTNMAYWIEPNAKYYLSQPGLYIFAGNGYDLALYDENGNLISRDNCLNITIVRTENNPSFVMANYKSGLISSIDSAVPSLSDKCYVHNTNTSAQALVFRLTKG